MPEIRIPFNKPYMTGREIDYIKQAHSNGHLSGDGPFTKRCQALIEQYTGCRKALLTHSCTAALEMAAILLDLQAGDEVIMPSYTFVSTANAFVLRGAVPVFVDIRDDTLNIDEQKIEQAITPRTRAICVVHYAGVACEMDAIMDIADRHGLFVVEDAAQALLSSYRGKRLGSFGHLAALSFHETKNVISGEGGALLINDPEMVERAEVIREKGTNRNRFFRGQVDKYTWVDLGSSFLPGEITAAFLLAQLEQAEEINAKRMIVWNRYDDWAAAKSEQGLVIRPHIPAWCSHNAHMYYLLLTDQEARTRFLESMRARGIGAVFHYIPLHDSPAGAGYGRAAGDMRNTSNLSERLVRLPLWIGIEPHLDEVTSAADEAIG